MRHFLSLLLLLAAAIPAPAALKVYYLRHAESGANIAGDWKTTPKEQWPPYVGNANAFSPKGEVQATNVVTKLKRHTFDFIAVSPLWRTRHTVLPYLRATSQTAELWPELAEFAGPGKDPLPSPLPEPSATLFTGGKPIALPADEAPLFKLRADGLTEFKMGEGAAQREADRLALCRRVVELIRKRFGGSDKTLLLVGHGNAGRLLASVLTQDPQIMTSPDTILKNTSLWLAEEQPDGTFRLTLINDQPWPRRLN
jgi:broad specificity phosphatase PhoE